MVYFNENGEMGRRTKQINENKAYSKSNHQLEKSELDNAILHKCESILKKKEHLKSVLSKLISLGALLKRNKKEGLDPSVKFPFLLVSPKKGDESSVGI